MRRLPYVRSFAAVLVCVVVALSVSARPREDRPRDPREKREPIVKVVKRIIKSLGDGLIVPTP